MTLSLAKIKRLCSMLGIDLNELAGQAAPVITQELDKMLGNETEDNEKPAFILFKHNNEYYYRKVNVKEDNTLEPIEKAQKIDTLISKLINIANHDA